MSASAPPTTDTIFALATAPGQAAVAIVRVSGPRALSTLSAVAGRLPPVRQATLRRLIDPVTREPIDDAIVLRFAAPASFTGEDVVEFHLHGGSATVDALTEALGRCELRPAEPGEFTRRAFENGRLELSQAEAVGDLVEAETAAQRRQALDQLGGALALTHARWRTLLVEVAAQLEAAIDFPDDDLPPLVMKAVFDHLRTLEAELTVALDDRRGERVRGGYRIALFGPPNSGKSSLLNRLTGERTAIVTARPGTTRDVVAVPYHAGSYRVLLADMAGVRASEDEVEAEGVARALAWAESADLRLLVIDGSRSDRPWAELARWIRAGDLLVINKSDLPAGEDPPKALAELALSETVQVSALTGVGMDRLVSKLGERVTRALSSSDFPAATRARHRDLITSALSSVRRALADPCAAPELLAEDVRVASTTLARITGRIGNEHVLDAVFATFCIGK